MLGESKTIMIILADIFKRYRDNVLFKNNENEYTYNDFLIEAFELATSMNEHSSAPRVSVISNDTHVYFVALLASAMANALYVPLDIKQGISELKTKIDFAGVDLLITDDDFQHDLGIHKICYRASNFRSSRSFSNAIDILDTIDYESEFIVTFTSGTTAEPKGVVHSLANLIRSAEAYGKLWGFSEHNTFLHCFPPSYMAGILNQFILPMIFGSKIMIDKRFSIQTAIGIWERLERWGCDVLWVSPTMLSIFMSLDRDDRGKRWCSSKQVAVITATAPLPLSLRQEFERSFGVSVYESFGLTETLFNVTNMPSKPIRDGSIGYVIPGTTINIMTDGELVISCEWMFKRYLGSDEIRTSFSTGDLADIHNDALFITGRKKDLIIRGGMNISPSKIEQVLDGHVECDIAIFGVGDKVMGERIVLAYASADEMGIQCQRSHNELIANALGPDSRIDEFVKVDAIPRNSNGKIDRNKLKELYDERSRADK